MSIINGWTNDMLDQAATVSGSGDVGVVLQRVTNPGDGTRNIVVRFSDAQGPIIAGQGTTVKEAVESLNAAIAADEQRKAAEQDQAEMQRRAAYDEQKNRRATDINNRATSIVQQSAG